MHNQVNMKAFVWLIKYIWCLYKKKSLVAGKIAQWAEALAAQMSPLLRVLKVYFSACQSSGPAVDTCALEEGSSQTAKPCSHDAHESVG